MANDSSGDLGADKFALVWFGSALVLGVLVTILLARIDRQMYDTNAEVLDYQAYKENRRAASSIASESSDSRVLFGSFHGGRELHQREKSDL
jgi:hypothetical protein